MSMNKITKILSTIKQNLHDEYTITSGDQFEIIFGVILSKNGFDELNKDSIKEYIPELKLKDTTRMNSVLSNNTPYQNHFIQNPCGSQSFPDFLVFENDKIYVIELKFTSSKSDKSQPFWNAGPTKSGFYVYANKKDLTYFRSIDIFPMELREVFDQSFSDIEQKTKKINESLVKSHNRYNFEIYNRRTIMGKYQPFNNPDRLEYEQKVLDEVNGRFIGERQVLHD